MLVYLLAYLIERKSYLRRIQYIEYDEVQRDIAVGEALCLPRPEKRIVLVLPAVHGDIHRLRIRRPSELYRPRQERFYAPSLIVIGAAAHAVIFFSALESVYIEFLHEFPYTRKVLYKLCIHFIYLISDKPSPRGEGRMLRPAASSADCVS